MNRSTVNLRENQPFEESIALLLRLHDLIAQGKGDDEAADVIRDRMEAPWYDLTRLEKDLINGLSADLYTIGQDRRPFVSSGIVDLADAEFKKAVSEDNWPRVLDRVRLRQDSLPSDEAAFVRAVAWMHLGQSEIALRFFRDIERSRQLSDAERIWLLTCLMQTERIEEILAVAKQLAESANPLLRLRASNALSLAAQYFPSSEGESTRQRAIAIAEEAIWKVEPLIGEDRTAKLLWQSSLAQLALDYQEIGDSAKAVLICDRLLKEQPNNLDLHMLMDWLTYEEDPDQAKKSFRRHFTERLSEQTVLELPSFAAMVPE